MFRADMPISHSHMVFTDQPKSMRADSFLLSLSTFLSNFSFQ